MAQSTATSRVSASADDLYAYLSEVSNLPEYFPKMKSATAVEGGRAVVTTAVLDDGSEVEGEAWFETNEHGRSIEWGSEGEHGYRGALTVSADGDASNVEINIHTTREHADDTLKADLQDVLRTIKDIVERQPQGERSDQG